MYMHTQLKSVWKLDIYTNIGSEHKSTTSKFDYISDCLQNSWLFKLLTTNKKSMKFY